MAKEIERKFRVDEDKWNFEGETLKIQQAYLMIDGHKVVRVRISNDKAFLTIKGNLSGITRDEFEYEIPTSDALQMMSLRIGSIVEKTRYVSTFKGKTWEVDVFEGENSGLIVAEIELESENEPFEKPVWLLNEVSDDERYYNFNLSKNPYSKWQ
ncbi:MAG: CYTH domain-containing protein [Prolixibacteraceae bacterium]